MKPTLLLLALLFFNPILAQLPVADIGTNTSLGIISKQLGNMNVQLTAMNQNLSRIINLLEENNQVADNSRKILEEELEAKKSAPQYVTTSTDVSTTIDLKTKILEAYRSSKRSVEEWEYLNRKETQEYIGFSSQAILETTDLFKQCKDILTTKAIIQPEERLKKVNGINSKLENILDKLIEYNKKLSSTNSFRKSRRTLIDIEKK